ncbi:MAG: hypothetical protein IT326_02305 [Anaerolineae bacterium]|nr:hypothetical protein [Anaerolineae bacterium]
MATPLSRIVMWTLTVAVCGAVAACAQPPCDRGIPELYDGKTLTDVDTSLLSGEPCTPPCWQGLTPGESTDVEAMGALENLSFVYTDSILRRDWGGPDSDWEVIDWKSSVSGNGSFLRLDSQDKVTTIVVNLEYELTLQDLIDILGEPDAFTIIYTPESCRQVGLTWLRSGIEAWPTIVRSSGDEPLIAPDQTVKRVIYFSPVTTVEEYLMAARGIWYDKAHQETVDSYATWTGFDDVRFSRLYPEE